METIVGLRKYCEGFSQINADSYNSIFEYCKKAFIPQGVFVIMERLNSLNMTKFITQDAKHSMEVPLRLRIVLQTMSKNSNNITPIGQIAHGMVLEIAESPTFLQLNILVYPVPYIPNIFKTNDIISKLIANEYDVYEIEDGTTCNIYYDKNYIHINDGKYISGKWMFSTRKSYDIEKFEFMGEKYSKIFSDILSIYNFNFDNLVIGNTYTIGFKHPAHHPFGQPIEWNPKAENVKWIMKAWLICIHDCNGNIVDDDIGIPRQMPIDNKLTFKQMQDRCRLALRDYNIGTRTSFYGYILRSRNPEFSRVGHICMDSRLFTELRQNIYNLERRMIKYSNINFKRKENVILTACLNYEKRKIFFLLFPQFQKYKIMVDEILRGIARKFLNKPVTSDYLVQINNIYQKLGRSISLIYKPTGDYQYDMSVLMGIITNYTYLNIYSILIFN